MTPSLCWSIDRVDVDVDLFVALVLAADVRLGTRIANGDDGISVFTLLSFVFHCAEDAIKLGLAHRKLIGSPRWPVH